MRLDHLEQNTTLLELILEVDHQAMRIERLDGAIDRAINDAPEQLRALVDALQALRGVAKVTAITLATEFGRFSRFEKASQVMSYTDGAVGALERPSQAAWRHHEDWQLAPQARARGSRVALPAPPTTQSETERIATLVGAKGR